MARHQEIQRPAVLVEPKLYCGDNVMTSNKLSLPARRGVLSPLSLCVLVVPVSGLLQHRHQEIGDDGIGDESTL